ncbi:putative 26S proteasome non-ATPase regulatory subunit 3 [Hibiscus syriacus]|uniref:26S proteasome non-ATPase regulatory subunit 3 n=1 Tax=Hibiscus syriacus TaxID=106335 RepID=A0A6A2YAC7_HIBSY|nr:putative 26S proteasome non-ATPase regulatory subunit 3 [Hibiscus syriacus]
MEVDTATSAAQRPAKHSLLELEIYCYLLVLIFLIGQQKYDESKVYSSASIARLKNLNRRTLDVLATRLYFYYSLCYELEGSLAEIRSNLLALHWIATLRHDKLGYPLKFFRYLFYLGKIRTIQLEYTNSKECLLQAARKAPVAALGFRAVRIGDLELFRSVADNFSSTFNSDRTNNLIVRLRQNVIRTRLRNISISYSRFSLTDVAKKLRLDSVADAESIVAKAIRDGAIDATLDHSNGCMLSKETGDIYLTTQPQMAFNSRIAFCFNMQNEAVRALRFPPNSHKEKESAEKRRERQQQEQELAKHIAEEDDDEF